MARILQGVGSKIREYKKQSNLCDQTEVGHGRYTVGNNFRQRVQRIQN